MATPKELYYEKRGKLLVKHLQQRHFDAYYCANKEEALAKALELIPEGASVGWAVLCLPSRLASWMRCARVTTGLSIGISAKHPRSVIRLPLIA